MYAYAAANLRNTWFTGAEHINLSKNKRHGENRVFLFLLFLPFQIEQ